MKLDPKSSYAALYDGFVWDVPEFLNMGDQACDDWAKSDPHRVAIRDLTGADRVDLSYATLKSMSDQLAFHLQDQGIKRGDRVGVLRPQDPWTAAAHIAIWKLGAISVPLFTLFQSRALAVRLEDSGAKIVVCDRPSLRLLDGQDARALIPEDLAPDTRVFTPAKTRATDPAILIYTSGTTGTPKGALHGHHVLTGHLPCTIISQDFLGQTGDCFWTPADWAWIGGLFDVLMPALALGVPVVAARLDKFSAAACADVISRGGVRNVFFPPTALRMLKAEGAVISGLRSVGSGGEPLGAEMLAWARGALGVDINEFYGQTECNLLACSSGALFPAKPGCIGKPVPGYDVAVLDENGEPTTGEGDIAVRRGPPSMMLRYWNRPQTTAEKFIGDWMLTGDRGVWDGDYLRFVGREDDVITSSGYRIGPAEIEDCLLQHAAVATVGVIGKPDPMRTEIVKAYVVLKNGVLGDAALASELQEFVKTRLARYSYPREIGFVDALPMTVTGKVIRKELKRMAGEE